MSANIHPETLLATDFLNHYNEVIMLFGMLPDMPACLEDVETWEPKTYPEHFRESAFQGRELAIAAYDRAEAHVRAHFEYVCARLDARIKTLSVRARELHDGGRMHEFAVLCDEATHRLSPLLDELNAIIHGTLDSAAHLQQVSDHDHTQAEIDALFD